MFFFLFFYYYCLFFLAVLLSSEDEDPGAEGGDEYEEGQELDSDIDEDDLWPCPQCNLKNHPMSRQCARCWMERHEWLPHLKRFEPVHKLPSPLLFISKGHAYRFLKYTYRMCQWFSNTLIRGY